MFFLNALWWTNSMGAFSHLKLLIFHTLTLQYVLLSVKCLKRFRGYSSVFPYEIVDVCIMVLVSVSECNGAMVSHIVFLHKSTVSSFMSQANIYTFKCSLCRLEISSWGVEVYLFKDGTYMFILFSLYRISGTLTNRML